MPDETAKLAAFASGLRFDDLPADVPHRVGALALDLWGIMIRACHESDSTPSLLNAAATLFGRGGPAGVVSHDAGATPAAAALVNGTLAHSLDFDDTHAPGSLHPSAAVLPAALAAAQHTGADGRRLVTAIVAGYETACRLSLALVPASHYDRGFHPSATCGTFGAAAAAGVLLGLDAQRMEHAFGICCSQAAGSMQYLANGAATKRFQVGAAAMNGLMAAQLAHEGFHGAAQGIEGENGFLRAHSQTPQPQLAAAGLGDVWETMRIALKPYPSCRFTHAAIDAIAQWPDVEPAQVERLEVGIARKAFDVVGQPEAAKRAPRNLVEAQFSIHFAAAVALREGGLHWDHFARHLDDSETLALCRKVEARPAPEAEAKRPPIHHNSALVTVRLADGSRREHFVELPRGEPETFFTAAELEEKFRSLAAPYLAERECEDLIARLGTLAEQPDVETLFELSRPPAARRGSAA